jgi:hypothetical protein
VKQSENLFFFFLFAVWKQQFANRESYSLEFGEGLVRTHSIFFDAVSEFS